MMRFAKTIGVVVVLMTVGAAQAESVFKIGIMQSKKGEAKKYAPLISYMKTKGVEVKLVGTKDYPDAAKKFGAGQLDAMFSGSGVAGSMIIKGLADPLVRPDHKTGWSTYWAIVVAPKGSPKFTGDPSYFEGKKVLCCSLASSGEFFFRSIQGKGKMKGTLLKASSHGAALSALAKGAADVVVVKNRVWDSMKKDPKNKALFAKLEIVGRDKGQNPNGTLIVAKSVSAAMKKKVTDALLSVEADKSAQAVAVKTSLKVKQYITTTVADFKHTIAMLAKAGVDKSFNFVFDDKNAKKTIASK
jgi:ABC-type phosphate/phosphonate transport system substrate-binding protein